MRGLDRKLWRDVAHLRGQVAAIIVVMACGVMSYVAMSGTWRALLDSREEYYRRYRFGDLFASLKRAPEGVAARIGEIPGVTAWQTRIVTDVTIDLPGLDEPGTGRLVSIPTGWPEGMINGLHLLAGRSLDRAGHDEVIVSGAFAEANALRPGDQLPAVINGRRRQLTIVGVALSPEYIYEIRPGDLFPDPKRFGVLWMSRETVAPIANMVGAFNDLTLALGPGAKAEAIQAEADRLLAPYGGIGVVARAEQTSHRFISNELDELRVFGTYIPGIFLAVTAFLLNLVLSRLVMTQREQIGVLKAFGFGNAAIGSHFLKLSLLIVAGGVGIGIGLGWLWGRSLAGLYAEFFRFPVLTYRIDPRTLFWAIGISGGATILGALGAVRRAVALPPAEAMRPIPPTRFQAGILERLGLERWLPLTSRVILRNLERTPAKSGGTMMGIALSIATLFIGFYFFDAIDHLIEVQFRQVFREDATVFFNGARPPSARFELERIPGVLLVEPFRSVAVEIAYGARRRRIALQGVERAGELRRIIDTRQTVHRPPPEGLLLSQKLAEILDARQGDRLTIRLLEGDRRTREVVVTDLVDDMLGLSAYLERESLDRLLGDGGAIHGAHLRIDPAAQARLYRRFKETPAIQGLLLPGAVLANFEQTMARTIWVSTLMTILLACTIAFGLVYNGARIALSERGRELASLRVLGFTRREIATMLLGEQALLTLLALPVGFGIGFGLCALIIRAVDTELIRLPLVISGRTLLYSGGIILAAAAASALLVRRRLERLNLIEVLKTRE